jgi:hypothetical protein
MFKRLALIGLLAAAGVVLLAAIGSDPAFAHTCSTGGNGHGPHAIAAASRSRQATTDGLNSNDPPAADFADATDARAKKKPKKKCHPTKVMPNWRNNYIPLFGLEDREDPNQRYEAQRWRDECEHHDSEWAQTCGWYYGGTSFFPDQTDPEGNAPNEAHVGFAATHCFLFEFAHQCEGHDESLGESVHDAHGGALYVDVCLTRNAESRYCREGQADTQAGVTIMDHFPCGAPIPIAYCIDEYHVIRPLDAEYTQAQFENSQTDTQAIVEDPQTYLCGYGPGAEDCPVPALGVGATLP